MAVVSRDGKEDYKTYDRFGREIVSGREVETVEQAIIRIHVKDGIDAKQCALRYYNWSQRKRASKLTNTELSDLLFVRNYLIDAVKVCI